MYIKSAGKYLPPSQDSNYVSSFGDIFQRDYKPLETQRLSEVVSRAYNSLSRNNYSKTSSPNYYHSKKVLYNQQCYR